MSCDREGHPSKSSPKEWVPVFSKDRKFKEDRSWKDNVEVDGGDDIGILVQEDEGSVPSFKTLEIEEYCEGASLDDLESAAGCAGQRRLAWLDDRSCDGPSSTLSAREYENPLTATGLYRALKRRRFDVDNLSDADRRLIYIANLDPHYIRALGETASAHQVGPLRDAIWSHLILETLIRVKVSPRGYPIFQMMLHIPYFALRASPLPKPSPRIAVHSNPPRQWMDLSFLEIPDQKKFIMHEAQITFLICGSDDQRWAAYAFDDIHFDEEDFGNETFSYEGIQDDPIARGKIDANLPIGDPREYFLMIFDIRLAQVREEWKYLVRMVDRSIIKKRRILNSSGSSLSSATAEGQVEDPRKTLKWTRQTIDLLGQLQERLSETIEAWEGFSSSDGDIGYFSDIDCSPDAQQRRNCNESIAAIKETFEILRNLQRRLVLLEKTCQNLAQALQLLFIQESSEAAWDNVISSKFTSLLSPLALAATIFNIPQTVIPFPMTFKSLTIVVLIIVIVSFGALSLFRRRRKRTTPWMNTVPLESTTRPLWTSGRGWRLGSSGGRNHSDSFAEGV